MTADPRLLAARGRRRDWPNRLGYTLTTVDGEWDVWYPLGRDGCWVANFVPCGLMRVTWNGVGGNAAQAIRAARRIEIPGIDAPDKSNVAVFADQSPTSSGFTNNLGSLRTAGLIEYPGKRIVRLTEQGRALANANIEIKTLGDLHQAWFAKLSRPKQNILAVLIEAYPNALPKSEVAERSNQSPTSSSYTNNLGSLHSLGLVEYPKAGYVVATELLFPDLPQ